MELQVGSAIKPFSFPPITQEQLQNYAEASGDFNPIHLDETVAKQSGLPGVIAHGMLIASLIAGRATQISEEEPAFKGYELIQFQSRFKAMTLLGDIISIGGQVKDRTDQQIILELQAKNQRGELTTVATAKFKRPNP